jgi:transmembrane sensor
MNDDSDTPLLDRYLSGECTLAERKRVERWLAQNPANAAFLDWMRRLKSAAAGLPPAWDLDRAWNEIRFRVEESGASRPAAVMSAPAPSPRSERTLPEPSRSTRPAPARRSARHMFEVPGHRRASWSTHALRVAAAVALIVGALALWRIGDRPGRRLRHQVAMRTYATRASQRAEIHLMDGTLITLAPRSVLRVPDTYDRRTRDVYLRGQAYFEVAHDVERPFRVHSGDAVTRVLGTKFSVGAYREDSVISVIVAEGAVTFSDRDTTGKTGVVLSPGDLARLGNNGAVQVEHGVDVQRQLAWIDGKLVFVNRPLREVIPQLDRWYDIEIRLADPALADRPLTATLQQESTDQMLRLIAASLDVRAKRDGRLVTLFTRARSS